MKSIKHLCQKIIYDLEIHGLKLLIPADVEGICDLLSCLKFCLYEGRLS